MCSKILLSVGNNDWQVVELLMFTDLHLYTCSLYRKEYLSVYLTKQRGSVAESILLLFFCNPVDMVQLHIHLIYQIKRINIVILSYWCSLLSMLISIVISTVSFVINNVKSTLSYFTYLKLFKCNLLALSLQF